MPHPPKKQEVNSREEGFKSKAWAQKHAGLGRYGTQRERKIIKQQNTFLMVSFVPVPKSKGGRAICWKTKKVIDTKARRRIGRKLVIQLDIT